MGMSERGVRAATMRDVGRIADGGDARLRAMNAKLREALKDSYEEELYSALHAGVTGNGGKWWPGGMSDAEWFCRQAGIDATPTFTKEELMARVPEIAAKMVTVVSQRGAMMANLDIDAKAAEIARLRERCAAYKGQVESGAVVIERLRFALDAAIRFIDPKSDPSSMSNTEMAAGLRAALGYQQNTSQTKEG